MVGRKTRTWIWQATYLDGPYEGLVGAAVGPERHPGGDGVVRGNLEGLLATHQQTDRACKRIEARERPKIVGTGQHSYHKSLYTTPTTQRPP